MSFALLSVRGDSARITAQSITVSVFFVFLTTDRAKMIDKRKMRLYSEDAAFAKQNPTANGKGA